MKGIATDIAILIVKYMQDALSEEETGRLKEWIAASPGHQSLFERLTDPGQLQDLLQEYYQAGTLLHAEEPIAPVIELKKARSAKRYWMVAASLIALLGTGAWFYFASTKANSDPAGIYTNSQDVQPGKQKATLILADKKQVNLASLPEGIIAQQEGAAIRKTGTGHLQYEGRSATGSNTLVTPRGGFFQLTLSDGTKVWLNAETALSYPVAFSANKRRVELLRGEAYFEVAHDEKKPFIVQGNNTDITVLGTKFNIQAYPDEMQTTTTLLQGSVRITPGHEPARARILSPGQEALVQNNTNDIHIQTADAANAIAWVGGKFHFKKGVTLYEVSRQLERWYDVQFQLEDNIARTAGTFQGDIERNIPLSAILKNLARIGNFQYDIQAKTVRIYKDNP